MRATTTLAGGEVEIVGVPDFMLLARAGYAIRDSKLARRVGDTNHPEITAQLETYGWLYERTFGQPPIALQVHNGAGAIIDVPYEGGGAALRLLEEIVRIRQADVEPRVPVGWSKCAGCGFFGRCWPAALDRNDVGVVAGLDLGLTSELHEQGIENVDQFLAAFDEESLAELERPWGGKRRRVGDRAARILAAARATRSGREVVLKPPAIPEHPSYVMFDLEGLPPQLDELEKTYLWGTQVFGERPGEFGAAVAGFGSTGDRAGWESFLDQAAAIFAEHGDIPFVHWASYEASRIKLYLERFGDRDGIAARVQRNLVDLLPIAYESVVLPVSSYGLKQIERHLGFERELLETGGEWSMARYIEATETGDAAERNSIMAEILTYNREDLEATWAVTEWLRGLERELPAPDKERH